MKKLLAMLLAVVTALGAIALSACGGKGIKGEMTISHASAVLPSNGTLALSATFTPADPSADVSGVTIKWSSSKKSVATVDQNGVVTAVGAGNAKITAAYGKAKATCEVQVFRAAAAVSMPDLESRINISVNQQKLGINLRKLGQYYATGDTLIAILDENGDAVPFTQNGDVATVNWSGEVGMHAWTFFTNKKSISAEICHATHILGKKSDFAALNADWDVATLGNTEDSKTFQNATKDWYIAMDADIDFMMGVEWRDTYTFGRWRATDGGRAVFNGTFDGRGYFIKGLRTRQGFISILGTTGVIKNLALIESRNGEGIPYYDCGGGTLGEYASGTVENVFIDAYLYYEDGNAAGMYKYSNPAHPLTVKNCLVMIEIKPGAGGWVSGWVRPGLFTSIGEGKINLIDSYGVSSYFHRVDAETEYDDDIVFTSFDAFINSGAYADYGELWGIGENNVFFGGNQVWAKKE